jgi:hypothetical protein
LENIIKVLNNDIEKCKQSLESNNLLEISISIEEMIDKYKKDEKNLIDLEKSNVWQYNKDDLKSVIDILENLKVNYMNEYKINCIREGFDSFKINLELNKEISEDKKAQVLEILNELEDIANYSIDDYIKWENIKKYIEYIVKQDFLIGSELLKLVALMF